MNELNPVGLFVATIRMASQTWQYFMKLNIGYKLIIYVIKSIYMSTRKKIGYDNLYISNLISVAIKYIGYRDYK